MPAQYVALSEHRDTAFTEHEFNSLKFNIHSHPSRDRDGVAVFIHGFGGHGYTTWRDFPRMLYSSSATKSFDVAIFTYASGVSTAVTHGSRLDEDVHRLVAGLRELEQNYKAIYLICHSLGGLVAGQAVVDFLTHHRLAGGAPNTKIAGMFVFASPRAGSGWANPLLSFIISEFRWLRRFSGRCLNIESFFTNFVQSNAVANTLDYEFLIPRFAYIGSGDRVVDRFSASFGIPHDQVMVTTGNHRTIVKPTADDHPQVDWLRAKIAVIEQLRVQRERESRYALQPHAVTPQPNVVVTQLWHDPLIGHYADVFNDVRNEASRSGIVVQDVAETEMIGTKVDLLVAVHDASTVASNGLQSRRAVVAAQSRHRADERLTVGLTAVGPDHEAATAAMCEWLLPDPPTERFYVEGAANTDQLRTLMWQWIQRVIRRNPERMRLQRSPAEDILDSGISIEEHLGTRGLR